jgi:hypothetical protein
VAYVVAEARSGQSFTVSGSASNWTFDGIGKRSDYRVEIAAINAIGAGAPLVIDSASGGGGDDGGGCHPKKGC